MIGSKPLIFFNVGWMRSYRGTTRSDKIIGGGSWVAEHNFGYEACNFFPWRGWYYGYVQPPGRSDTIKIERLGADKNAKELDDVTVVWTAKRPGGGTVVVGWYRHATVYRHGQPIKDRTDPRVRRFKISHCYVKAKVIDCHLVEPKGRWFEIPRVRPGMPSADAMGQSNVWFAEGSHGKGWYKRLASAIRSGNDPKPPKARHRNKGNNGSRGRGYLHQNDPELRRRVEKAAIASTRNYFNKLGFKVVDVSRDNHGWDLKCLYGRRELHVEVKGTSSGIIGAELTPNEYAIFRKRRQNYRLVVVTSALTRPKVHDFWWDLVCNRWITDTKEKLRVAEVTSARVREA